MNDRVTGRTFGGVESWDDHFRVKRIKYQHKHNDKFKFCGGCARLTEDEKGTLKIR